MPTTHDQTETATAPDAVRPGAVTALLEELARAPDSALDSAWGEVLRPGAVVGRFELVREIGRGGFGIVYEARDRELGRLVAFKAIRAGSRPDVREVRALREAEVAARMSHPNVVTLFDAGRCEHGPFLVLELLRGETLAQRLEKGPLAVRDAMRIGVEVAKGLAHAHSREVVHRDVTPRNVFLCEDGQVKLLDLGMGHAFGRRKADGGTPAFMAPEQRRGAPEDERTDVFALGVLLYRMLANELPFPDRPSGSRRMRTPPLLKVRGVPGLGELVGRMLATDPAERPRDAQEVVSALSRFQEELARVPVSHHSTSIRRWPTAWRRTVAVITAAALLATAVIALVRRPHAPAPPEPAPSIAVLPFANVSGDSTQEPFSVGLSDEIRYALARVPGIHVAGRTSSMVFKDTKENLRTIAERLNVASILEGTVRRDGKRIRITAQVVDAASGHYLWAERFDRELTGVFDVQDEIGAAVAGALKVKLTTHGMTITAEHRTSNPEVYNQFLLGKQFMNQITPAGYLHAQAAFEKALSLDPSYAPAWAGLSFASYWVADTAGTPAEAEAAFERARIAAEKAVALAPDLADGYVARGTFRYSVQWDWDGAKADLERAVALSPGDPDVVGRGVWRLLHTPGRLDGAIEAARKATQLDPLSARAWARLGQLYRFDGQFEPARAALERSLEIAPEQELAPSVLGDTYLLEGRPVEALAAYQRCTNTIFMLRGSAVAYHDLGRHIESQRAVESLIAEHGGWTASLQIAEVHAWRGERDLAFEWLERAYARRDAGLWSIKLAPLLRTLRGDPRFAALVAKMKLPAN